MYSFIETRLFTKLVCEYLSDEEYAELQQALIRNPALTRIIHEASTAAADPGMSAALRSVGFLDVLLSTAAESSRRAPCIHARLRRLATNLHE
jgi:hypothetical protein